MNNTNNQLNNETVYEEYIIDGKYHSMKLSTGIVQSRCYSVYLTIQ